MRLSDLHGECQREVSMLGKEQTCTFLPSFISNGWSRRQDVRSSRTTSQGSQSSSSCLSIVPFACDNMRYSSQQVQLRISPLWLQRVYDLCSQHRVRLLGTMGVLWAKLQLSGRFGRWDPSHPILSLHSVVLSLQVLRFYMLEMKQPLIWIRSGGCMR